uniref:Peptide-N-glycosidase F N-terminal domain-containing protein n=3 Tax=Nothobranchius korthausae TaxID=1143690 RepID=A0A1A8EX87_9TELE
MALLPLGSAVFLFLVVTSHVTEAAGRPKRRMSLSEDDSWPQNLASSQPGAGPEPGDVVAAFTVSTLGGKFSYLPGALNGSLVIHAFTNKSGFLESLWSSESSLTSLVDGLPDSTQVLFLSLDDSAVSDVLWMREQLQRVAMRRRKEVLAQLHFSPVPVFALGNWIPSVFYYWGCVGHNCGFSQAVFTCDGCKMPIVIKRLDARYDWLAARWSSSSYQLVDVGDGCDLSPSVAGSVAWVSEVNCSFFNKVQNMAQSNAAGVLVYSLPGNPIQDMNCVGDECNYPLNIPAAMVHEEVWVTLALRSGQLVNVSFQTTPSPNFFIGIDQQGALAEMGWFLYPAFNFINWQAQWFEFVAGLKTKLQSPAKVVSVFDKVTMQGEKGAVATVDLPLDLWDFDTLQLDLSLSCPSRRDSSCAQWDHTVQLFLCCDELSSFCNTELGRWITAFRRGIGRWLTDVSPLLPLLNRNRCTFTLKTVPWAMPWIASLSLRFSISNQTDVDGARKLHPFRVMPLFSGGTFDKSYNKRYWPTKLPIPKSSKKVELYAVITGHGSDENGCGEFCVTSHHFLINSIYNNTLTFDSAGTALGCTMRVKDGAVPNEHGTWLYGRGGWCDGLQVDPWRVDITKQLDLSKSESNTVVYFGLFDGLDPDPAQQPGYIIMSSFLIFYK